MLPAYVCKHVPQLSSVLGPHRYLDVCYMRVPAIVNQSTQQQLANKAGIIALATMHDCLNLATVLEFVTLQCSAHPLHCTMCLMHHVKVHGQLCAACVVHVDIAKVCAKLAVLLSHARPKKLLSAPS